VLNSCEQSMAHFCLIAYIQFDKISSFMNVYLESISMFISFTSTRCLYRLACRSLKLAMQSGAFVQLVLMLAAIAARMDALVPEILDVIQLGWTTSRRILEILDVRLMFSFI
jgi:hypothetical protein